jgi:hypothetical protein
MESLSQQLAGGQLTLVTGSIWLALALVLSIAGGATAGVVLAGKDLGNQLAALMGGMFGPTAVMPAVVAGLVVLRFL